MTDHLNQSSNPLRGDKDNIVNQAKKVIQQETDNVQQSAQDWICYIKDHPLQSIFVGLIGVFALRGFMK